MKTSSVSHSHNGCKLLVALFAVLTAAVLFGSTDACAKSITDGDFSIYYKDVYGSDPKEYKDVTVEKYTGSKADVVLPATVTLEGKQVPITTIKSNVFKGNEAITSVTIPEGYTELPYDSFKGCISLKSINIPGSLTMVASNVFEGCTALETVTFDKDTAAGLTLGNASFTGCTALKSLALPARLSHLNMGNVFYGCTALDTITVDPANKALFAENNMVFQRKDDGTAILAVYPFGSKVSKLEIPAQAGGLNVTELGPHLFRSNAVLTEVTVPATVTTVERFAFNDCSSLKTVNILTENNLYLNSSCFLGMPEGSVINVPNAEIAAAFEPADEYTTYYDNTKTTVKVAGAPTPVPATVEAALTLKAAGISAAGEAKFDLYLDSASCVNTLLVKLNFNPAQLTWNKVALAGEVFSNVTPKTNADGTIDLMFNKMNNVVGYTGDTQVKIATITMKKAPEASGRLTLTIAKAAVSGITDVTAPAIEGTVTLTAASDSVFVANYDVNRDGTVNQVDITEAQRYYQETSAGNSWTAAMKADVNGDGKVDLEDLVAIFRNLTAF